MKQEKKYDIFISYRRDGGQETARILRDSLTQLGYHVFFDVESLRSGAFNTKLYSVIAESQDFILVLSPNALDRCSNSDDWVRREITHAFAQKKNIIPILLRGFEFPQELPEELKELPYQSGLNANVEYYDAFVKKLESFLHCRKKRWSWKLLLIPAVAALLTACLLFAKYPTTPAQVDLTERVVANVGYNLANLNSLASTQQELLQAAESCLITGERDVCSDRFAVCANAFSKIDLSIGEPDEDLLNSVENSRFGSEELREMHHMVSSFYEDCLDTMAYMEFIVSEECMLTDSEKLKTVDLYERYLEELLKWYACCTNEMLIPVTNEKHLESFWTETLPYMGAIPLNKNTWSRDQQALVEAGNECYENLQSIQMELNGILGDSTMALRQEQEALRQNLINEGFTEARAEKIVAYMGRDWEHTLTEEYLRRGYSEAEAAALAKEEAAQREWELDVMYSRSARITDGVGILWEKLTYLMDLKMYDEAEECIMLYQIAMTNSDRYLPAVLLYMQMKQQGKLDHGIMVMEYYRDDGINEQLMIGDIIYQVNGEPCCSVADYLSIKAELTDEHYTVKLLRLDENKQIQILELIIPTDAPRVYINDLLPVTDQ